MPNKNGLILITPTSVDKTGTGSTATVSANGSVEFSSCATLSLNGVFSADYDNYMIVMRHISDSGTEDGLLLRLRSSGSDASGSNYVGQYISADGTAIGAGRTTDTYTAANNTLITSREGFVLHTYGPNLAQPTAGRSITVNSLSSARIADYAWTHSLSTSYDGITFFRSTTSFTGLVCVYGMRK
jgi:hypothetical protein